MKLQDVRESPADLDGDKLRKTMVPISPGNLGKPVHLGWPILSILAAHGDANHNHWL